MANAQSFPRRLSDAQCFPWSLANTQRFHDPHSTVLRFHNSHPTVQRFHNAYPTLNAFTTLIQRSTLSQRISNGYQYVTIKHSDRSENVKPVSFHEMIDANNTFVENKISNGKTAPQRWNTVVPTAYFSLGPGT